MLLNNLRTIILVKFKNLKQSKHVVSAYEGAILKTIGINFLLHQQTDDRQLRLNVLYFTCPAFSTTYN